MKKEMAFNEIIRKVRKDLFGKGPERIRTVFIENMAITTMHGNLTSTEKFISQNEEGRKMVHNARTQLIQDWYDQEVPPGLEDLVGAKLTHLFSDIKVDQDMAVSVFIFEHPIV
ncbi:DUF2294 domain-containing protein [Pullulanibacillus sp. KACC 23026]|uniref:DUF2294 domain-containing protein n=1 Tax=Pullulanibacillus sp. KACC 23026 TaxID=3028315 RepID=UPI0023AF2DC2|nr:DUF2294 domain-containing protein [Pullulanibacillus sp. KACC 23026]WEG12562.1 DUF2294 domain-containing protein [Pullulanibacillus sp. KACC 23026]